MLLLDPRMCPYLIREQLSYTIREFLRFKKNLKHTEWKLKAFPEAPGGTMMRMLSAESFRRAVPVKARQPDLNRVAHQPRDIIDA